MYRQEIAAMIQQLFIKLVAMLGCKLGMHGDGVVPTWPQVVDAIW